MQGLIDENSNFVVDPSSDRKPVEFTEDWCNVVSLGCARVEPCRTVKNPLELPESVSRESRVEGITIIQAGGDKSL